MFEWLFHIPLAFGLYHGYEIGALVAIAALTAGYIWIFSFS